MRENIDFNYLKDFNLVFLKEKHFLRPAYFVIHLKKRLVKPILTCFFFNMHDDGARFEMN